MLQLKDRLVEWIQKQDPYICCLQESHFRLKDTYRLKVRGGKIYSMPILLKLFQKLAEEEALANSFYEATITLIPKPAKTTQKRKQQANIIDEYRCKNPQQILANRIQQHIKKLIYND